uniref:Uncharacterized protein n=1 Tax=Oryzias sinensis TaxID=183150 RepID=A0A8C7YNH0_9TELE
MEALSKMAAPATEKIRQLQKMVQDIRKNDGSLLDKLRRLKNKPLPNLPAKDYKGETSLQLKLQFHMNAVSSKHLSKHLTRL